MAEWPVPGLCGGGGGGLSDLCVAGLHIRANGPTLKKHVFGVRKFMCHICGANHTRIMPESYPKQTPQPASVDNRPSGTCFLNLA